MNKTKLNPGLIASYDLRPGNAVVTILVEWKGMDERREYVKQTKKEKKVKKRKNEEVNG